MKVPKKILLLILFQFLDIIDSSPFIGHYLSYLSSPLFQEMAKRKNICQPLLFEDNYYEFANNSGNNSREENEANSIRGQIFTAIRNEIESTNISKSNASRKCIKVINKYLFGHNDENNLTNISYIRSGYHIAKGLDDSSKSRNYLGSYDQCMLRTYRFRKEDYIADSTFIVLTFDKTDYFNEKFEKEANVTIMHFEFDYYLIGICLPQGFDKNEYCTDEDYKIIIEYVNEKLGDYLKFTNATISVFTIGNNPIKEKEDSKLYEFICLLPFIFFAAHPAFLVFRNSILFLINKLYFCLCFSKKEEEIIEEDDNKDEISIDDSIDNDEGRKSDVRNKDDKFIDENNKLKILYKIADCFSFTENGRELFNFSLTSTKYNNDSGLGNVKGIKGISIFFMVIGWTFVALYNSPVKIFTPSHIENFMKNSHVLGAIIMIGVRYSPRIIISCSGYTLIYKYISYLEKNLVNNSEGIISASLNFFISQLHKYFLLILILLFERFSSYYLYNRVIDNTPIWKFFYLNILSKPNIFKFLLSLILINYFVSNSEEEHRRGLNLLHYFWLPFNEIFFFIFGIILISIGYKKKYKIDKFILILIVTIYILKVIFSYLFESYYDKHNFPFKKYYPTLYYIYFNYGKLMINPLFNLPYFLIGMYFGLMNYTIQKGIYSLKKTDLFTLKKEISDKKENKNEVNQEDNDLYYSVDDIINKNNHEYAKNNENEYCPEAIKMPFLITPIIFVQWHRKQNIKTLYLLLFIFFVVFLFFVLFIIVLYYKKDKIDDTITNKYINFIYRIDIEFIVLFVQWGTFIIFLRGHNFASILFSHIFWSMLSKPYFSFIIIINTILLFIFYQSETLIEINDMNILLYSLIGGTLTFIFTSLFYILFELPYKRLIRLFFSLKNAKNVSEDADNDMQYNNENSCETDDDKEKKE